MRPGRMNLITDVPGILVGNAADAQVKSGVSVVTAAEPLVASVHVMGGAPGTRETDLLSPDATVPAVDALVLSGGSAFGLEAAAGVTQALRDAGRGFDARGHKVPIVPGAIIFDLAAGGAQDWSEPPWRALGRAAFEAAGTEFTLGSEGVGVGATTANLKGGLGSASAVIDDLGVTVGAIVAANPIGSAVIGDGPNFWAAPWEDGAEFGGLGPGMAPEDWQPTKADLGPRQATTIAVVATDMALSKAGARRLAVMAHDGIARAVSPAHTPFDGDLVFAASTGRVWPEHPELALVRVGHAAATCLARAIARAVYEARPAPGDVLPCWSDRFGG